MRGGRNAIAWLVTFGLVYPAWIFSPPAYAVFSESTTVNLPVDDDDSYSFAVADLDGVNGPDVVVANRGQSRVLINAGNGVFTDETATRLPLLIRTTVGVAIGDVDGVNGPDIFLAGSGNNRLLINDGAGNFTDQTATRLPADSSFSMGVAFGDVDGDGDVDVVVANRGAQNSLLLNDGAGVFADATAGRLPVDADLTYGVALGDVNGDGGLDVLFANLGQRNRLLANDLLGRFTDVSDTALPANALGSHRAVMFDADGDGDTDIAVANGLDGVELLINDGAGTFAAAASGRLPALVAFVVSIAAGDVDFDGAVDLVLGNAGQDRVWRNDGAGNFFDVTGTELPADSRRSFGNLLVDADGDFDLDLLVATPQGQNRYYDNFLAYPRIRVSVAPDYIEVTDTATIAVQAFDEDGVDTLTVEVIQPDASRAAPIDTGGGVFTFVPTQIGTHTVRVTATDLLANAGTRDIAFLAQANDITAPAVTLGIVPASVTQGQSALFTVTATDDRAVVGRTLTVGGVNVPLNAAGVANYVPLSIGTLAVVAEARDAAGNVGRANGSINVLADIAPPVVNLSATPDPVDITNPIAVSASATDNIRVSAFAVTVSGPAGGPVNQPVALNAAGNGSYTPFVPGTYTFTATARDAAGNVTVRTVSVVAQGIPDTQAPLVSLSVVPGTTVPGGTVTLTVNATDNVFVLSRTLAINGTPVALDAANQATFSPPVLGDYTAVATASDPTGNVGTDTVVFSAVDPATDTDPPVVAITAPAEGSDLESQATFTGTVTDLTLVGYELAYAPTGSGAFTTFATGSTPVIGGTLGTLDTSVLDNGLYDIRLRATDINGRSSSVVQVYTADGGFKPGVFTVTYTDLRVPVTGIPVTIKRTYDSRARARSQDFGNGWNLEVVQDGRYTNNRVLGQGWFITRGTDFLRTPCSVSNESLFHITEVRFSDTEFYKFAFEVEFFGFSSAVSGGCGDGQVRFVQVGGVPGATLDVLGTNAVFWQNGSDYLTYEPFDERFGQVFDVRDVRLTTLDGRVYDLNLVLGLTRIGDNNGNSIFINSNGVVHSNGTSIGFVRDAQNRITRIIDPAGRAIVYGYDGAGNLTSVTDRGGNVTRFSYVAGNYLDRIEDPLGNSPLRNEYDAQGRLIAQIDAEGNRTEFDNDPSGASHQITDREGNVTVLQYTEQGRVSSATAGGASATYTYDERGNKLTETDPNGNTRSFTYDANNQMTSETDALGNAFTYTYDAQGRPSRLTDPGGSAIAFAYDANGNVTAQRDASGTLVQGFGYDTSGNVTSLVTAAGASTMGYDARGNLTALTLPSGASHTFTYDPSGRPTSASLTRTVAGVPVVETTRRTFDANGNVLTRTDALGNVTGFAYNAKNRKTSETDALGRVRTFAYDTRGNLQRINYPDGTFEVFGYDRDDRRTAHTDRAGRTTFFEFDADGRLTRVVHPDGATQESVYDAAGNLTQYTDPAGNVTTYEYDAVRRLVRTTDALGNETLRTYLDDQVMPATVTDPLGNTTTYVYDRGMFFGENLVQTTLPDGATVQQTWGAAGRVTSRNDANGNVTRYTYDAAGNLLTVTDALGGVTRHSYDEARNRVSQTDALGRVTRFTYDAAGRMLSRTLPGGEVETRTYDAVGNLLSVTDFNGDTTTFEYDDMNRLIRRVFPGGDDEAFTYTPADRLASVVDARGTTTFGYDLRDRLISVVLPDGATLGYTYDDAGNRTSVTTPAGTTRYTHDALNRIATVVDPAGGTTRYEYDSGGNISAIEFPNGTEASLAYDNRNRTVRVTHAGPGGTPVLADYQYAIDDHGNRIELVEATGRRVDYTYDAMHRLVTEAEAAGVTTSFSYDAVGNVTLTTDSLGGSLTSTFDVNDRVLSVGARDFAFDANGNLLSITDGADVTTFEYDVRNRLVRRTGPGTAIAEFEYDHAGNRIARSVDGIRTEYLVDTADPSGLSQVLLETDGAGAVQASYVHGNDLLRMDRGAATSIFHTDALGSTRALTDGAGALTDAYDYSAFGNDAGSIGATENEYLFAGERRDPGGLYHLRARYYDPEIGRFLTRDPFPGDPAAPLTLNPYLYGVDNPVNVVDPSGEFGFVSISISISISLASFYLNVFKPAKEVYDEAVELVATIPNKRLNEDASRDELGLTPSTAASAITDGELTALINLGGGAVEKAYSVVYKMTTTAGNVVALIHAFNAASWMKYLPVHPPPPDPDGKPAHYVSCEFNHFVQKEYSLGLITGLGAAKRLSLATNIIGTYLAYFTFLALMGSTVNDFAGLSGNLLQPASDPSPLGPTGPACPGLGL